MPKCIWCTLSEEILSLNLFVSCPKGYLAMQCIKGMCTITQLDGECFYYRVINVYTQIRGMICKYKILIVTHFLCGRYTLNKITLILCMFCYACCSGHILYLVSLFFCQSVCDVWGQWHQSGCLRTTQQWSTSLSTPLLIPMALTLWVL